MIIIFAVIMFINFEFAYLHLKNLGEVKMNWTSEELMVVSVVAGGSKSSLVKYPFNVKFLNFGSLCGGAVITVKHVLTAAHCFEYNDHITEMQVISSSESIFGPGVVFHDVWHFKIHEHYGVGAPFANDIAVLIIHGHFTYGEKVKKAILVHHPYWMTENERKFIVTGWGETENEGESNYQIMREAELRYISLENCSKVLSYLTPDMFCLFGDGQKDTGRGDSGGGVLWNEQIVGITSHGRSIKVPGVYANVFYFLPWIKDTTLALYDQYCDFHNNNNTFYHGQQNISYSHVIPDVDNKFLTHSEQAQASDS